MSTAMASGVRSPFHAFARVVYRHPVLVYLASLLVPALLAIGVVRASPFRESLVASSASADRSPSLTCKPDPFLSRSACFVSQAQYDVRIDTGILSFRARDEPYAVTYDSVLAALQWSKAHTRRLSGPPAPPAPANAPPPIPDVERRQSHAAYWLTTVYETRPPGGNVLEQNRLDFIRRVEDAVTSAPYYDAFCHKVPLRAAYDEDPRACSHWVPPGAQEACAATRCSTPMSLLSFEQFIREWFENLTARAAAAPNATAAAAEMRAALVEIGFSDEQADQFAEALAANTGVASAFAAMPLVDLLKFVPPGALTKDVFRIGHEPGWFFDRFYATGVADSGSGGTDTTDTPPHAVALRSAFEFALPLVGYATARDRLDEQDRAYRRWVRRYTSMFAPGGYWDIEGAKAGVRVLHAGGGVSEDEATALVLGDLNFAAGAFALVFVCVLAYVRSWWTATNAVLGVALAFPSAFFFVRVTADSPFVSFLAVLVPFVLIGIGCDDAMVMCDAFKASVGDDDGGDEGVGAAHDSAPVGAGGKNARRGKRARLPSEAAFTARFASAAKAMLATSLTTAVAFGSNVFSYIPPVRALGAYAAATVVANYALVLTLLPAALLIRAKGFHASAHDAAAAARGVFEPRAAAYAPLDAEVELQSVDRVARVTGAAGAGRGRGDGTDEATVRIDGDASDEDEGVHEAPSGTTHTAAARPSAEPAVSPTDALGAFVVSRRVPILAVSFAAVLAAGAAVARGLAVAEKPPPLLRPDTNLQRVQHLLFDVFYTENWSTVRVAFGVRSVDRSAADPNDPTSFGAPVWDEAFDFSKESVQRGVLAACEAVAGARDALRFTPSAGTEECAMQAFVRDYVSATNGTTSDVPWGPDLPSALAAWSWENGRAWRENLGWAGAEGASALTFLTADYFVDLHPVASTSSEIRSVYAAWVAATRAANEAMARAMRAYGEGAEDAQKIKIPAVVQACDVWNRMGVEESIRHTAFMSPPVSAAAAAVIMLAATRSLRVTLAALVTIAAAVVLMLAALVAAGWEFGVVEELCVTLLIGSSIDYCIHLAVAYAEAETEATRRLTTNALLNRRHEKVKLALGHVAPTITGAAVTTAASCAMLLLCQVEVLVKIGATIVANTVVGYALTLLLFSALVATYGE